MTFENFGLRIEVVRNRWHGKYIIRNNLVSLTYIKGFIENKI
jgi:hypothetical protein